MVKDLLPSPATQDRSLATIARLPADLSKLCERFLNEYPEQAARVDRLAQVPIALRHLLALRLDLNRAETLPHRYRELAVAALQGGTGDIEGLDAVDRLVVAYAAHAGTGKLRESAALLPRLRQYFAEPQVVELALVLALTRALALFDQLLDMPTDRATG
jgi:hypothetical protein